MTMTLAERVVIGSAIEEACALLPDGWIIRIDLEADSGTVKLLDPQDDECTFATNHELFSDEVRDALAHAISVEENKAPNT